MKNLKFLTLGLLSFGLLATSCDDDESILDDVVDTDVYVSSNTTGKLTVIDFQDFDNVTEKSFTVPFTDADGIAFRDRGDVIFQLSRSGNRLVRFNDVDENDNGATLSVDGASQADIFTNGRGIVLDGDDIWVAQDGNDANGDQNRLFKFEVDGDMISLRKTYDVDINLWGIAEEDGDLYAIVDNSNRLAVFEDFGSAPDGTLTPDFTYNIQGITRTHGIHINDRDNILLLTDIGDAGSDSDGAIHVIEDFKDRLEGARDNAAGTLFPEQQKRISGGSTQLGNPVDIDYDQDREQIYVAERANGGGKVLIFEIPETSGDATPVASRSVEGASSIALDFAF